MRGNGKKVLSRAEVDERLKGLRAAPSALLRSEKAWLIEAVSLSGYRVVHWQ